MNKTKKTDELKDPNNGQAIRESSPVYFETNSLKNWF